MWLDGRVQQNGLRDWHAPSLRPAAYRHCWGNLKPGRSHKHASIRNAVQISDALVRKDIGLGGATGHHYVGELFAFQRGVPQTELRCPYARWALASDGGPPEQHALPRNH
jgi:hypothetical protein